MLKNNSMMKFQSKMMQQNLIYHHQLPVYSQYQNQDTVAIIGKSAIFKRKEEQSLEKQGIDKSQKVIDLEDMWQSLEAQNIDHKSKIKVVLMDIGQQPQELTAEQFNQVFGAKQIEITQPTILPNDKAQQQIMVEDFSDLWNQLDDQNNQLSKKSSRQKQDDQLSKNAKESITKQNQNRIVQSDTIHIQDNFQIIESGTGDQIAKGFNLKLGEDFLIYDCSSFVMNCFQTNIRCYFGFYQSKQQKNHYFLYDLSTKQPLIECYMSPYEDININSHKKINIDYDTKYCLKFRLVNSKQHIATIFHKYINNGILYNLKPFNYYQHRYEDSFALIEITDGYAGSNCFCNTSVFISQKYTSLPGQLKMILGIKNGFLIANMGLIGVKSAPYNCRLQNNQSKFVYLLGLIDKETEHFIVRVGEGMSPLLSFAISIGRKRYIESFKQQ